MLLLLDHPTKDSCVPGFALILYENPSIAPTTLPEVCEIFWKSMSLEFLGFAISLMKYSRLEYFCTVTVAKPLAFTSELHPDSVHSLYTMLKVGLSSVPIGLI